MKPVGISVVQHQKNLRSFQLHEAYAELEYDAEVS